MKMKHVLAAGFGALALGLVATTAQAAPVGGLVGAVESNATDASLVEKATFGHRRYGYGYHYGYRPYYYGHYGYKPYYYGYDKPYYRWHKPYGWRHGHRHYY
jgi:hypothetical protein